MTALAVLVLIGGGLAGLLARRRAHARVDAEVWPWVIEEIGVAVGDGRAPSVALLGVALHGPPPLRMAAEPAVDLWRSCGDPVAGIRALQRTMTDPRLDRICRTLEAAEAFDGDVGAALARLRTAAIADAGHDRQRCRHLMSLQLAAWLALAPVTGVITGHVASAAGVVAVTAAVSAWAACVAMMSAQGVRVFVDRPMSDRW